MPCPVGRYCDACNRDIPKCWVETRMAGGAEGEFCIICRNGDPEDFECCIDALGGVS